MHRFFVDTGAISGDRVELRDQVASQVTKVLRLRAGENIIVLDDTGFEYLVELDSVNPKRVIGLITNRIQEQNDATINVNLYQSVLKGDRLDYVFQKCTELGVVNFVPILCSRALYRGPGWSSNRMSRWRTVVKEASEQSERSRLPSISGAVDFETACDMVQGVGIILWEREKAVTLKTSLICPDIFTDRRLTIFVGPEGGFTDQEVDYAKTAGIASVSLGKRILRAETAAISAVSIVMHELGELDP